MRRRITFVFEEDEDTPEPYLVGAAEVLDEQKEPPGLVLPNGRAIPRRPMGFRPPEDLTYGVEEPPP